MPPGAVVRRAAFVNVPSRRALEIERGRKLCGPHKSFYFSEVLTEVNTPLRLEPTPLTAVMIAMAMPAAIRPYSMAVAPDSSDKNLKKLHFNSASTGVVLGWPTTETYVPLSKV